MALQWRYYERNAFSSHRRLDCFVNRLLSWKQQIFVSLAFVGRIHRLLVTSGFPLTKDWWRGTVSTWLRHHGKQDDIWVRSLINAYIYLTIWWYIIHVCNYITCTRKFMPYALSNIIRPRQPNTFFNAWQMNYTARPLADCDSNPKYAIIQLVFQVPFHLGQIVWLSWQGLYETNKYFLFENIDIRETICSNDFF